MISYSLKNYSNDSHFSIEKVVKRIEPIENLNILLGGSNNEIDLTSVIQTGNGVKLIKETSSSFPAFQFNSGHNVIDNALDILPEKLPAEFSIIVKIR